MKAVATFHQPTSVIKSFKGRVVRDSNTEYLVVAKLDRIEVFSLGIDSLVFECGIDLCGTILSIQAIVDPETRWTTILAMLDHPDPQLIHFLCEVSTKGPLRLRAREVINLAERTPRPAEFLNTMIVDPTGQYVVVSCYVGKLKILNFVDALFKEEFDVSLPELTLLAFSFLSVSAQGFTIALLHVDYQNRTQLLSREVVVASREISSDPSTLLLPTVVPRSVIVNEDYPPALVAIYGSDEQDVAEAVLLIGGQKLLIYKIASEDAQTKAAGKRRRNELRKQSMDPGEAAKAKGKEKDRQDRKRKPDYSFDWLWSEITSFCSVDRTRFVLGDAYGRIFMFCITDIEDPGAVLIPLGETSSPTTMSFLSSQVLYLGSHVGNSYLIKINPSPESSLEAPTVPIPPGTKTRTSNELLSLSDKKETHVIESKGSYLSVIETYQNIAPIVDGILVDLDGSGQQQVVTCSGGRNTGAINIVRSGADFEETAFLNGIENVTKIWPLRANYEDKEDTHILVSTMRNTHLYRFNDKSEVELIDSTSTGFETSVPTLAAGHMAKRVRNPEANTTTQKDGPKVSPNTYEDSAVVVQVTSAGVSRLEYELGLSEYTLSDNERVTPEKLALMVQGRKPDWKGREIIAAALTPSQIVLALSGAILVLLNLTESMKLVVVGSTQVFDPAAIEVSALAFASLNPESKYSNYIAVSFWGGNYVQIYLLKGNSFQLVSECKTSSLASVPRSLLLHNLGRDIKAGESDYHPYLLVGMSNGSIACYRFSKKKLLDPKIISLGDGPVSLAVCEVNDRPTVFGCGTRVAMLSVQSQRLQHSPVVLKEIAAASRFNTRDHPSSLILANDNALFTGQVKELNKLHIRPIQLGLDNPKKIRHHPLLRVFGVACTRIEPVRVGEIEVVRSSFRLLDDATFHHQSQWNCEVEEEITALETLTIGKEPKGFFVIGTTSYTNSVREPSAGRIIILSDRSFEANSPHNPRPHLQALASEQVNGAVYAMSVVDHYIVAAVNASVVVLRFELDEKQTIKLFRVTHWTHSYFLTSLASFGTTIVAGDAISSVCLLKLENASLKLVARDYGSLWPVCVEALSERSIIGANTDHNLFSFELRQVEQQTVLEKIGGYHIGDRITKFIPGSLASHNVASDISLVPRQLFFTASGRIGVIVEVGDELAIPLISLQRNMAKVFKRSSKMMLTKYRAPKKPRSQKEDDESPIGFLDGDFLERFMAFDEISDEVEEIMEGGSQAERIGLTANRLRDVLEALHSMH